MSTAPHVEGNGTQPFTRSSSCPICGGHDAMPHGKGQRCYGFLSSDGKFAHCTREQCAGDLPPHNGDETFAHRLRGSCKCGATHTPEEARSARREQRKARADGPTRWTYSDRDVESFHVYPEFLGLIVEVVRFKPEARKRLGRKSSPRSRVAGSFGPWMNGTGAWKGRKDCPLYREPDVIAELEQGGTVYIVEGEKDADTIFGAGGVACSNMFGAGKFYGAHAEGLGNALRSGSPSAKLIVVQDQDEAGRKHVDLVVEKLAKHGANAQVVRPVKGKDAHDAIVGEGLSLEVAFQPIESGESTETPEVDLSSLVTRLSDVKMDRWEYLFQHRIAYGALTMLFGAPGLGKSAVIANLVAKISLGQELPDGRRQDPMTTLLMTREDDPAKTLKPRYEFVGADMDRVFIWDRAPCEDGKMRPPNVVDHLGTLDRLVREFGIRILIVDPFLSFLPADVDAMKKAQAVADALNALADLVRRLDMACVLIAHPPKGSKGKAIDRIFGTVTIAGTIRSAIELRQDPDDPDHLLLVHVKSNIGPAYDGLRLRIDSEYIEAPDGGAAIPVSSVEWVDVLPGVTADSLDSAADDLAKGNATSPRTEKAMKFLEAQLSGAVGPGSAVPLEELESMGKNADISRNALFAAKKVLGVKSTPRGFSTGVGWYIPIEEPGI